MNRRSFLQITALAAASQLVGWRFSGAAPAKPPEGGYDAVVIGAGLGGLCCAAHLARNGFKTILLEQHYRFGGYATSFPRRDSDNRQFSCEVSLHASALTTPGTKAMLGELGIWDKLELAPHKDAWSSRFPGLTFAIPAKAGLDGFERQLAAAFPAEAPGIGRHFSLWRDVMGELALLDAPDAQVADFPKRYPSLWSIRDKAIGQVVDANVTDPQVRAILTQSCNYYGLPPSRLSAFFYLGPTGQYLESGGYYLKGTSQTLADALVAAIRAAGGEVLSRADVTNVLVQNGRAVGVKTADGREFRAKAVVANASAPQLFSSLLPAGSVPRPEQGPAAATGAQSGLLHRLARARPGYHPAFPGPRSLVLPQRGPRSQYRRRHGRGFREGLLFHDGLRQSGARFLPARLFHPQPRVQQRLRAVEEVRGGLPRGPQVRL